MNDASPGDAPKEAMGAIAAPQATRTEQAILEKLDLDQIRVIWHFLSLTASKAEPAPKLDKPRRLPLDLIRETRKSDISDRAVADRFIRAFQGAPA